MRTPPTRPPREGPGGTAFRDAGTRMWGTRARRPGADASSPEIRTDSPVQGGAPTGCGMFGTTECVRRHLRRLGELDGAGRHLGGPNPKAAVPVGGGARPTELEQPKPFTQTGGGTDADSA